MLSETFRAFAEGTTDYNALVETIARKLTELIGDACVVALATDDGTWLEPTGAYAEDPAARATLRDALGRRSQRDGSGNAVRVVRTGEPVLIPQIDPSELAERAEPAFAEAVRKLGIRSFLAVPLEVRGRRLGVLSLFRYLPSSPPFGDYERALALSVSDHAALAISNAQLFESLQRELAERQKAEERAKTFVALIENSTNFIAMAGSIRPGDLRQRGRASARRPGPRRRCPDVDPRGLSHRRWPEAARDHSRAWQLAGRRGVAPLHDRRADSDPGQLVPDPGSRRSADVLRDRATGSARDQATRERATSGAEDRGARQTRGWRRPRLQQSVDRHPQLQRDAREVGAARRPRRARHRADRARRATRSRAHASAARVQSPASARAEGARSRRDGAQHGRDDPAADRRGHRGVASSPTTRAARSWPMPDRSSKS